MPLMLHIKVFLAVDDTSHMSWYMYMYMNMHMYMYMYMPYTDTK